MRTAQAQVITAAAMDARPEFGGPDALVPRKLDGIAVRGGKVSLAAPSKSVIVLDLW